MGKAVLRKACHGSGKVGKKRVRFAPEDQNKIVHHNVDTDDWAKWYNNEEYFNFRMDARRTIMAFREAGNNVSYLDPTEHCLRGLEKHQLPEVRAYRKQLNKRFIRLVICQHVRLCQAGIQDPDCLKQFVEQVVASCQKLLLQGHPSAIAV